MTACWQGLLAPGLGSSMCQVPKSCRSGYSSTSLVQAHSKWGPTETLPAFVFLSLQWVWVGRQETNR